MALAKVGGLEALFAASVGHPTVDFPGSRPTIRQGMKLLVAVIAGIPW
jgi:hypothetical protein